MTTLQNDRGKTIQFSVNNTIHECGKNTHIIEMPVVVCSDRKDAECMQREIISLINELGRELLK